MMDWSSLFGPPKTREDLLEDIKQMTPGQLMGKCPDCLVARKDNGDCPICGRVLMMGDAEKRRQYLIEHPEALLNDEDD